MTVVREEAVLLRLDTTKVRDDVQESSMRQTYRDEPVQKVKPSIHYRVCPQTRHSRTERHVFTPGGLPWAKTAEGRVTAPDRMGEVSRRLSNRLKRAPQGGGGLLSDGESYPDDVKYSLTILVLFHQLTRWFLSLKKI